MGRAPRLAAAAALIGMLCSAVSMPGTALAGNLGLGRVKHLSVVPSTIKVGATATATITLRRVAKVDTVIDVTSSDDFVALPFQESVTIPAGKRSATDLIYGLGRGSATITATLGASHRSAAITIT
jgi:hypothetical protein